MVDKTLKQEIEAFEHKVEQLGIEHECIEHEGVAEVLESEELVDRDKMNQLFGQIQMARAISDFANVVTLTKLKTIRETKQYQSLKGLRAFDRDGNLIANVGTWGGFCKALGISRQKADEDLKNLEVFGADTLERLSGLGIGYREMRKLRNLSEEAREAVISGHSVNIGDKDDIVELIDTLTEKHVREKQALTDKVERLESDHQVDQRILADKQKKIDELERELARDLTPDQEAKKRAERDELLHEELSGKLLPCLTQLNEIETVIEKIMSLDDCSTHLYEATEGQLSAFFRRALQLGRQYDFHPDLLLGLPINDLPALDEALGVAVDEPIEGELL